MMLFLSLAALWIVYPSVTASGHGRVRLNVGNQGLLWGPEVRQAIGRFSSPSNSEGPTERGAKVLTQIRKRHAIGQGREETFYRQKERKPNSQFRALPRKRKVAFSRGPVEGEILVTEWPNRSRRLCWGKKLRLNVKEKKTGALRLVNKKLTNIRKKNNKRKERKKVSQKFYYK